MACRHPIIIDGKCVDCGEPVKGENGAKNAAEPLNEQIPTAATTPPENGQETPKKTTRKHKA
jgi:hypothetical protein